MIRSAVLILMICATAVAAAILSGSGDSVGALISILARALPLVPLAIAAALVISCGDIDLSPAGMFAFLGMLTLGLTSLGMPSWSVGLCVFAAAMLIGWFQGWAIAHRGLSPLIITLGVSLALFGVATTIQVLLQETARPWREKQLAVIPAPSPARAWEGMSDVNPRRPIVQTLPSDRQLAIWHTSLPWAACAVLLASIWRYRTLSALRHVAVGFDRHAATLAGIDVRQVRMRAFLAAAALVYIATMLYMNDYQGGGWTAATGSGLELTAIAAAVIGGTSITGGRFNPIGVAMGIGVWAALGHLCIMARFLDPEHQKLAAGVLLIIVAFLDSKCIRPKQRGEIAGGVRRTP